MALDSPYEFVWYEVDIGIQVWMLKKLDLNLVTTVKSSTAEKLQTSTIGLYTGSKLL